MFAKQIEISEITALYSRIHAEKIAANQITEVMEKFTETVPEWIQENGFKVTLESDAVTVSDGADVKIFKINFTEDEKDEAIIYAGVNVQRMLVENETK